MATMLSTNMTGFIPKEVSQEIVKDMAYGSTVLKMVKVEPMTSLEKTVPVLAKGAGAYFINEGQKITVADAEWIFPTLQAKKIAVIIPMSKEVLNRASVDVFKELQSDIAEAFANKFDVAALFGVDSPYTTNILGSATEAGNVFTIGSVAGQDLAGDISDTMALVEDGGFEVNGFIAPVRTKAKLRKANVGQVLNPVYLPEQGDSPATLYGLPVEYIRRNAPEGIEMIAGNFDYARAGILDNIQYEILREATVGTLNLAEQDMVALKATMNIAFLVVKNEAFAVAKEEAQ